MKCFWRTQRYWWTATMQTQLNMSKRSYAATWSCGLWVTDQRVILLTRDQTFYYMELAKIDGYQVLDGAAAEKCLVLGSCLFEEAARRLRWRACHPKTDIQGHDHPDQAMGMILYGLRDVETVEKLLRQRHTETVA